jgi:hypothetical protein
MGRQNSNSSPMKAQAQQQAAPDTSLLQEYEIELERLREENNQIRFAKDLRERDFENVMFENA